MWTLSALLAAKYDAADPALVTLVGVVVMMLLISPLLTLVVVLVLPVAFF